MNTNIRSGFRIISVRAGAHRLNRGRSTVYGYLDERSPYYKPDFPRLVRLGSRVGFIEHELDDYIQKLMQVRDAGEVANLTRVAAARDTEHGMAVRATPTTKRPRRDKSATPDQL